MSVSAARPEPPRVRPFPRAVALGPPGRRLLTVLALVALLVLAAAGPALGGRAAVALGDAAAARADLDAAERAYRAADRLWPTDPLPSLRLAELDLRRNRPVAAESRFDLAHALAPSDPVPLIGLARARLAAGAPAGALAAATEAADLARARSESDLEAAAWLVAASASLQRDDYAAARVALRRARDAALASTPPPTRVAGEAGYRLGLLLAGDDPAAALVELTRAASLAPHPFAAEAARAGAEVAELADLPAGSPARHTALGRLLVRHGLPGAALAPLEAATAAAPEAVEPWLLLGAARLERRDHAAAREALDRALALDPDTPAALLLLGRAARELGDLSASASALRRAAELDPVDPAPLRELALTYARAGAWPAAESTLLAALARAPDGIESHLALVRFHLDHVYAVDRGLDRAWAAVALDPRNAEAADLLGWALYLNGDPAGAARELRRAIALDPHAPAAHYHLGLALRRIGDRGGATAALERAIALDTTGRYLALARTALADDVP